MDVRINPTQRASLNRIRDAIADRLSAAPADQVQIRMNITRDGDNDNLINVQVEARIENPDDDYVSDWSWADGFLMNSHGRMI